MSHSLVDHTALTPLREVGDGATVLAAEVDGQRGELFLEERREPDGRVAHATIMVRPLAATKAAIAAMGRALEAR